MAARRTEETQIGGGSRPGSSCSGRAPPRRTGASSSSSSARGDCVPYCTAQRPWNTRDPYLFAYVYL
jgi:hypothetical protein